MRRHPLISFVLLAYGLTWLFSIPFVYCWRIVLDQEFAGWLLIFFPAPYGPTFAALLMTWKLEGRAGLSQLLRRLTIWRVGWLPWMVALFICPLIVMAAVALSGAGAVVFSEFHPAAVAMAPVLWILALPFGPLAEELGWRGWFLPRLQSRMTPFRASLWVGIAWIFWHIPMFWFPGAAIPSFLVLGASSVFLYMIQITGEAVLFTALFNRTSGSVLLAIVLHTTFNTAETVVFRLFQEPSETQMLSVYLWTLGITWVVALGAMFWPGSTPVVETLEGASGDRALC